MSRPFLIILFLAISLVCVSKAQTQKIDLSGEWYYMLRKAPVEIPAEGRLSLPGTLDSNGIGIPVEESDETSRLSRRVTFSGEASFTKNILIPSSWEGKSIELFIERSKPSSVEIDGVNAGHSSRISSPQRYDLTTLITPGSHEIKITVNNLDSIPATVRNNSHACTESTQTNWTGILGKFELWAKNPLHIVKANVYPTPRNGNVTILITLSRPATGEERIDASTPFTSAQEKTDSASTITLKLPLGDNPLWSEWHPHIIPIHVRLIDKDGDVIDEVKLSTGFRNISATGQGFTVNGNPAFLRGTTDACVFPLTAHTPMDYKDWESYFMTLKEYGINHVRFHSWCPPEECFNAADSIGMYLQPELPIWGEIDSDQEFLLKFLREEAEGIFREYSHHPSFSFFAIGNELWGDLNLMRTFLNRARELDPGILVTYGSNIYLGMNGHIEGEDYLVATRTEKTDDSSKHVRGSFAYADVANGGLINSSYPASQYNYSGAISTTPVPVVAHEVGQYQSYPDFRQIMKYTGTLRPDNLKEFAKKAAEAGTARKALKYHNASGQWATRLYRAETEMSLRTPGLGGFQLMALQDYPGQGTALVGLLDPFMDSKGFISPEKWRESCGETTILAEFPKFCFTSGEQAHIPVKIANYSGKTLNNPQIDYDSGFMSGTIDSNGEQGLSECGTIHLEMPEIEMPHKFVLNLSGSVDSISNSYDFWVFPKITPGSGEVIVTDNLESALSYLSQGESVILCPDSATVSRTTLGPLFQTDFWNYRMFRSICDNIQHPASPGTLGLLINYTHPALRLFPTFFHTDWQWFSIISNSRPLIIDRLPKDIDPIVEVIDNVDRNYRTSLMLECLVGKGKLMIISADLSRLRESPEGRWFLASAEQYMASKQCKPDLFLEPRQVRNLLTSPSAARIVKELKGISYHNF